MTTENTSAVRYKSLTYILASEDETGFTTVNNVTVYNQTCKQCSMFMMTTVNTTIWLYCFCDNRLQLITTEQADTERVQALADISRLALCCHSN